MERVADRRGKLVALAHAARDVIGPRAWWVVLLNACLCVLFIAIGLATNGDASRMFGEGKPGTLLSVLMLALASFASFKRAFGTLARPIRVGWAIFGVSLALAAVDDMFKLHEMLDVVINGWLGLDPDGFATKLDDLLVLLYAVPAMLVTLWVWRSYAFETPGLVLRFGIAGVFFVGMVVLDMADRLQTAEETCKVMAGSFIFAGVVGTPRDASATPSEAFKPAG